MCSRACPKRSARGRAPLAAGRCSWGSERSLRSRGAWEGPPESMRDARARLCVEVCALARAYASSDDLNQVRYLGLDGLIQRKAWMPSDFIAMR